MFRDARNEWIRATAKLVVAELEGMASDDDGAADDAFAEEVEQ